MEQFKHLLFISLITISISAKGQIHDSFISGIDEISITLGPNLTSLYNDNITSELRQPKLGLTAQLGLTYTLTTKFYLNVNFLYERKGLKTKYQGRYYNPAIDSTNCLCTTSLGYKESNTSMDYLMFSAIIQFQPDNSKFFLGIGPFIGHLLKAKTKVTNLWDNSYYYGNAIDSFNKTDFGVTLLLGYKFKLSEKLLLKTQLADNFGILNVSKINLRTTTNALSVSVGINYLINKPNSL